jgi:predicted nucleotidyltransferase
MRFHHIIEDVFSQESKIKALRSLALTATPLTGRQIASLSDIHLNACQRSLQQLVDNGFVSLQRIGRSNLYALKNTNAFIRFYITPLFRAEKDFLAKKILYSLRNGFKQTPAVISLILFGSVASKTETPDSDIDICVVLRDQHHLNSVKKSFRKITSEVMAKTGNGVSPYFIAVSNLRLRYSRKDKLIENVVKNGITFYGKPIKELINYVSAKNTFSHRKPK